MAERLQLRRDTAAQWEAVNPILRLCEIGLVVDLAGHVTGMKIGDGRVWKALPLIPIAEKVGTSMIADGAVTAAKIAEGVIPTKVSQLSNDENYAKTTDIPTKVSQLSNDAQYAKASAIPTKVSQLTNDENYAKASSIPTKVSELTNDNGYITHQALGDYATKASIIQVEHGSLNPKTGVYTPSDLSSAIGYTRLMVEGIGEKSVLSFFDNDYIVVYDIDYTYEIPRDTLRLGEGLTYVNYSTLYATKEYIKSLEDRIAALEKK